jgi:hypothetical protein
MKHLIKSTLPHVKLSAIFGPCHIVIILISLLTLARALVLLPVKGHAQNWAREFDLHEWLYSLFAQEESTVRIGDDWGDRSCAG